MSISATAIAKIPSRTIKTLPINVISSQHNATVNMILHKYYLPLVLGIREARRLTIQEMVEYS